MNRRSSIRVRVLQYAILIVMMLVALYPVWFAILASGRQGDRLYTLNLAGMFIPTEWTFENYQAMFFDQPFFTWIRNSFFVAGMTSLICLLVATPAAFAFSRLRFYGRQGWLILFLAIQAFPAILGLVAKAQILTAVGLYRNYWGLILAYMAGTLVFVIYTMKGYFDTIPIDLEEAGMVDGCGPIQSFLLISLPLARPVLATTALFGFMAGWSEFALANVIIPAPETAKTLTVALFKLAAQTNIPWGMFAAGAVMVILPIMIIFLFLQRYLESGLTLGGVKG
jgi:arabinogalactan oligomer/maltooligosaccharide transport system permease protein